MKKGEKMTRAKENWTEWKKILAYTSTNQDWEKAYKIVQEVGFYQNKFSRNYCCLNSSHYLLTSVSGQTVVVKSLAVAEKIFRLPKNSLKKAFYNGCCSYRNVKIEASNLKVTNLERWSDQQLRLFFDSPKRAIPLKVTDRNGAVVYYESLKDASKHLQISTNRLKKLIEGKMSYADESFMLVEICE